MSDIRHTAAFRLGDRHVKRIGYGAMQLAGPGVFGPPKDRDAALNVLREAVASGVNHIDTSDFYGPHVTNRLIREALHPYRDDLVIVTKIARDAATTHRGCPPSRPPNSNGPYTTTCATSVSTCSTSSTCASCSTRTGRQKDRSRRR